MKVKLRREVKLKSGRVIAKDTPCEVSIETPRQYCYIIKATLPDGSVFTSRNFSTFFKIPGIRTMHRWSDSGISRSVFGKKVEPDGFDSEGAPSWLLILGII
jgi:hypothetical protein